MNRNFEKESTLNFMLRAVRAATGRIRGYLLLKLKVFDPASGKNIYFGKGLRMINSRAIKIGNHTSFGLFARVESHAKNSFGPTIVFGDRTSFGDYFHAGATNGITVGSGVLGGSNVLIVDHSHGSPKIDLHCQTDLMPRMRQLSSKGPIIIEDNVWIGDNCVILGGSHIEYGAIIAANSVVSGFVPRFTIFYSK
jgi:carbonic anhydrase/acetyltransferase-like protein (isoleucine patch superfamily)